MTTVREETHESRVLQRLFDITHDILQAQSVQPALQSIALGLSELYGWKYVSIVASERPGGEMHRHVLVGFDPEQVKERIGEHIPRDAMVELLLADFEVLPGCYYIPAEREQVWAYNIYIGDSPSDRVRETPNAWHEHDSLTMALNDPAGELIGYVSVDGPLDGRVPSLERLRQMQLFVNLVGLALGNMHGQAVETERRQMLEQTSRAQSEFLAIVSHEVRSPLAAIRGGTALLDAHFDSLTPERRKELLGVLTSSTARLSAIFDDFLLLSRMDAGQLTLRFEAVDPIAVAEESVARMESQHPGREFRTLYLEPLPRVHADEGRVVQILTNMLSNAAKYSIADSVIALEIKASGSSVRFAVKNEGVGVAENARDKLFTRFGRFGRADGDASIGLGLYICDQLTGLMGGNIGYDSEPNKVTTFWFTLPRAAE
jgi:signal transduction histidine kinase